MPKAYNLIGQQFGRLVVIKRMDNSEWGKSKWLCVCNCGHQIAVCGSSLKNNQTKSCGCLQKEKTAQRSINHGYAKKGNVTGTYHSWTNMIQRCTNPRDKRYKDYDGRKIIVCKRWLKSFPNFLKDMGERPGQHSIDRINNDKGYCKENCRWATLQQQARNRRNNHMLTFNEKTQCISAWAEKYGTNSRTLLSRVYKLDWSIEKALTTPVRKKAKLSDKIKI